MFTYCFKDPHYVIGHCLLYIIILIDHVLWYLGLTLGCLIPFMLEMKNEDFLLAVFIASTSLKQPH